MHHGIVLQHLLREESTRTDFEVKVNVPKQNPPSQQRPGVTKIAAL
jgi:hypothetical protein